MRDVEKYINLYLGFSTNKPKYHKVSNRRKAYNESGELTRSSTRGFRVLLAICKV